jgi:serine/threonine protein kinase
MLAPEEKRFTMNSDREDLLARTGGLLLGKYRVERVLGEGGMAVVLAVRHTKLDELFAMKIAKPISLTVAGATNRFMREAHSLARLRSDHVVRVYDIGRLECGLPYMLLEYLDGVDLAATLTAEGKLSPARAIDCMLAVLDAMHEAHGLGIVHRDLKPENIFLARRPNGGHIVKVLDFGISKHVEHSNLSPSITQASSTLGSPHYMSPEQVRAAKCVDERADIWAIGVILYELVSGRLPFSGESVSEVCANVLDKRPQHLSAIAPDVPPELATVVMRCLSYDPADRYASAVELAAALGAIDLANVPRPVAVTGPFEPAWRADQRIRARETIPTLPGPFTDRSTLVRPIAAAKPVAPAAKPVPPASGTHRRAIVEAAAIAAFGLIASLAGWVLAERPSDAEERRPMASAANDVSSIFTPAFAPAMAPPPPEPTTEVHRTAPAAASSECRASDPPEPILPVAPRAARVWQRPQRLSDAAGEAPSPSKHHYEGIY